MNEERKPFVEISPQFLTGRFYECKVIDPPNINAENPAKCLFQIVDDGGHGDLRLWHHEAEELYKLLGLALGKEVKP